MDALTCYGWLWRRACERARLTAQLPPLAAYDELVEMVGSSRALSTTECLQ